LEIDQHESADGVMLRLGGELDIASAGRLQQALARVCADEQARAVAIDLRGLVFIDSTGLAAVVYASRICEREGCELALIRGGDSVHGVFELTGLAALLPFRDSETLRDPDAAAPA
jgi:anti-anti-sigma factor